MQGENALVNAVIGAVITILLSFVPFSPIVGGGVAGYLQGGDETAGAKVGALSGAIATLPIALLVVLVGALFVIVPMGASRVAVAAAGLAVFFVVTLFVGLYMVGLGALGGLLGAYLAESGE